MTMFRTLCGGLLSLLASSLTVSSCIDRPNFPDTPEIEFKNLKVQRVDTITGVFDRLTLTISFKDGDGDLGLSPDDVMPPYQPFLQPGNIPNPDHYNYFIQPQRKEGNTFVDIINPGGRRGEYDSRFPRLEPNPGRSAPLQGDLRFKIELSLGAPLQPGDEVRFVVSIKDRALNQSNVITTNSYIVAP